MADEDPLDELADRLVPALLRGEPVPIADCSLSEIEAERLGLVRSAANFRLAADVDLLDGDVIRAALDPAAARWLRKLEVWPVIGSTNTELAGRAQAGPIEGEVCLAELQTRGRGRRGRTWFSPLGGNLALSLGFESTRPVAELGGLSLVVGLAVLDALEAEGVSGLALKWPNDILRDGAKLGGILIEVVQVRGRISVIVGVGLNIRLPDRIRADVPQPLADLAGASPRAVSRSRLAGCLIGSIVDFYRGFMERGFAPFVAVFDRRHAFHGAEVNVLQGEARTTGRVRGVAPDGGLLLETRAGPVVVHAGDVSLRPA